MRKFAVGLASLVFALSIVACGPDSKHDLLSKAEKVETRAELEAALGAPDDRNKVGPLETWVYRASDGEVTFVIAGDRVRLRTAE